MLQSYTTNYNCFEPDEHPISSAISTGTVNRRISPTLHLSSRVHSGRLLAVCSCINVIFPLVSLPTSCLLVINISLQYCLNKFHVIECGQNIVLLSGFIIYISSLLICNSSKASIFLYIYFHKIHLFFYYTHIFLGPQFSDNCMLLVHITGLNCTLLTIH